MNDVTLASNSPTRLRTRTAILRAALQVLSENPGASLGEVADAAGVARSTLHRYFPERSDLMAGMKQYAAEQVDAATARARHLEGTAADVLLRLMQEYFEEWHAIMWTYLESMNQECQPDAITEQLDPQLTILIERGHAEGSIDAAMPNAWIQHLLWTFLYTAWEYTRQGSSKHESLGLAIASLSRVLNPPRP